MNERTIEIEKSITKKFRPKLLAKFTKAIKTYELLKPNDHVLVCISGGKDSMLMAMLFKILHEHSDFPFDVSYLVMNPGYNELNGNLIKENLSTLGIDAEIEETRIFDVAARQERSPCYLCAKMRRGALYSFAQKRGCNKIALGHHYDDVIETTLMNLLNAGSFQTMLPKLHSDNYEGIDLIRPMYLIREKDIIGWCNHNDLHFIACACKLTEGLAEGTETSKRKETKELIRELTKNYNVNTEKNLFSAGSKVVLDKVLGYYENGEYHNYLDTFDKEQQ